jgi:hypothetical protein
MKPLLLASLLIISCSAAMTQNENIQGIGFDRLSYFEPYTIIGLINKGYLESGVFNDSLSLISRNLMSELIKKYSYQMHVTNQIGIGDSTLRARVLREELYMFKEMFWHPRDITNVRIEPVIDSLIASTNHRYALLIISEGYIRSKHNYSNQVASQLSIKILTLGRAKMPHKYSSEMYVMIVDDLYKHVAFYRQVSDPNGDPLDVNLLDRQLQEIFDGQLHAN